MQIKTALKHFGLSEKQAKVYLAALELGSAPVARIAQKSKIPRATCYDVLESLCIQGIASKFIKNKIRWYSVEEPRKIVSAAHQKIKTLEQVMPELDALWGLTQERPQVRFFEGQEGIRQVYEQILEDKKDILVFSSVDDLLKTFEEYHLEFVERRIKEKIVARVIVRDTPIGRERKQPGQQQLRQVKLIPPSFQYQGGIVVFGNKIAYISFVKDYITVLIESRELAAIQRAALEYIWERAE